MIPNTHVQTQAQRRMAQSANFKDSVKSDTNIQQLVASTQQRPRNNVLLAAPGSVGERR